MRNLFEISEEEKNQIRGLHESYKSKPGTSLIWEQDAITPQSSEIDVYYFGVPGPKTEKIYHDNNKIYYFDGENTREIWNKDETVSYRFNDGNKKYETGSPLMKAQQDLQKILAKLAKDFGPISYTWENQKLSTYYMIMFGDEGKMFLNATAPVVVPRAEAKKNGLVKAKNEDGYYYADYKKSYIPLKIRKALITEIGFGKQITSNKGTSEPNIVIPKKFTFLLQDPVEFDSDVLTEKGKKDLEKQLVRLPLFLTGAFKLSKLKDVLDSPITLLGYASSDADPSAMDGGNLPACSQYGKGKGPRKNYDLCLSQERANRVKEKIDEILNDIEITRGEKPEKINTIFKNEVANWVKAKGLGQDSSKSGFDWKEPHDPSQTALDRRVEMTPPIITI